MNTGDDLIERSDKCEHCRRETVESNFVIARRKKISFTLSPKPAFSID